MLRKRKPLRRNLEPRKSNKQTVLYGTDMSLQDTTKFSIPKIKSGDSEKSLLILTISDAKEDILLCSNRKEFVRNMDDIVITHTLGDILCKNVIINSYYSNLDRKRPVTMVDTNFSESEFPSLLAQGIVYLSDYMLKANEDTENTFSINIKVDFINRVNDAFKSRLKG